MKYKKLFSWTPSALLALTLACTIGSTTQVQAQEITSTNVVAQTDFDLYVPGWDYGYFYSWGWGDAGQYADGTWLVDRMYDDSANGGTICMRYQFNNSPLYDLITTNPGAAYGTGFGGPQMGWNWNPYVWDNLFTTNYMFEFDARVEGLADGVTTANCQMQCQITATGGSPKYLQKNFNFNPGSNWMHFAFTFDDGDFGDNTTWQNFTNNWLNCNDVRFNVDMYMPHPQFGWDDYNVVLIDNLVLSIREFAGPPPPPPPTVAMTIADWNMDDKPLWYTYGGFNWSQNSYLPTYDYYRNDGPNTLGVGGSTAWWVSMTNTDLAPPNTPQWAGGGTGGGGPADFTQFTDNDLNRYFVTFDARAEGLAPDVTNTTIDLQFFMDSPRGNVRLDFPVAAETNWVHSELSFNSASWNTDGGRLPKASFATNYNTYTALRMQWQIDNAASTAWGYDSDNLIAIDNIKVVHQILACAPLSIVTETNNVIVTWDQPANGTAVLQSADSLSGPFVDVAGATSPYVTPVAGAPKYFRTHWVSQ